MVSWRRPLDLLNATLEARNVPRRVAMNQLREMPQGVTYAQIGDVFYPQDRLQAIKDVNNSPKQTYIPLNENVQWNQSRFAPVSVDFKTARIDPNGEKRFSYASPEDEAFQYGQDIQPLVGKKDIFKEFHNWVNYSRSPVGAGLYENQPVGGLDGKRARLYSRAGFVSDPLIESSFARLNAPQFLDTRRRYGNPDLMNAVYQAADESAFFPMQTQALKALVGDNPPTRFVQTTDPIPFLGTGFDPGFRLIDVDASGKRILNRPATVRDALAARR